MKKILLFLLVFPASLLANTYFEPYVGYGTGTFEQNITNVTGTVQGVSVTVPQMKAEGDAKGINLGLRLYEKPFNQIILGGDINIGIKTFKNFFTLPNGTIISDDTKYKFVTASYGLIVGWDIPTILLPRIWGGVYLDGLTLTADGSSDSDKYSGTSVKFGVSFDWWIQLGIEFANHNYTTLNGDKLPKTLTESGITMTPQKAKYNEVILTLSYPFDISK